jgi:cyclase
VVKGINFINLRDAGDPVEQARIYDRAGADELVFLDITATSDNRQMVLELARQVADETFIPFTIGGGIRTVDDVVAILRAGADKVSINSAAVRDPDLITQSARVAGSQAVVIAIDAREINPPVETSSERVQWRQPEAPWPRQWEVVVRGGRTPTGIDAVWWATEAERRGAGEILLTSMDGDGTQHGYDLALTREVAAAVNIPVIASGGAGRKEHFRDILSEGGAAAALAATLFHYRTLTIAELKSYLIEQGVAVRPYDSEYANA